MFNFFYFHQHLHVHPRHLNHESYNQIFLALLFYCLTWFLFWDVGLRFVSGRVGRAVDLISAVNSTGLVKGMEQPL
jgi:hypothetical protein